MSTNRITPTSYAVLGLLERCGPATPYELKRIARESIFHFWTIPHTLLYTECARLAEGGLLEEQREDTGRRRRVYQLSASGREALREWREDPHAELYELRDPGLLKLFCGADPAAVAEGQLELHVQRLARYEELLAGFAEGPADGTRLSLESGIGHEKEYIRFWKRLKSGT